MKKLLILTLFVLSQLTFSASAELGVNIGVSAQVGTAEASGSESENSSVTNSETEELLYGTGSFFIEKTLGFLPGPLGRLTIGYDHVPHDIGTGTATNTRQDLGAKANAGKQETMELVRAEKANKFIELKSKRNAKEYEEWFLRYVPRNNPNIKKSKLREKSKTKKIVPKTPELEITPTKSKKKPKKNKRKKTRRKKTRRNQGFLGLF